MQAQYLQPRTAVDTYRDGQLPAGWLAHTCSAPSLTAPLIPRSRQAARRIRREGAASRGSR
jgi:hypothetical protein